ncbi:MAG: hypothetical protein ABJC12_13555 [Saprospiraceae bacterium]
MDALPKDFIDRMNLQLGAEAESFFNSLLQPSPTSIRFNHKKGRSSFQNTRQIPWCEKGAYLDGRPRFQLDPHWHGGAYYVQEASSMILDDVLKQLMLNDTPRIWLDLCAAPGGKTGILASHLNAADVLIANEVIPQRKTILWENLVKGGYVNTFLTGQQPIQFNKSLADIILIDAPCSGEGMMRKETEAIHQWTRGFVDSCSLLQKQIVSDVLPALKPEGYLIYSTCSYSNDENIYNIKYISDKHGLESIKLSFPETWGISELDHHNAFGYQMYPHRVKGEGLFIAVLKNNADHYHSNAENKKQGKEFSQVPTEFESILENPFSFRVRKNNEETSYITAEAEEKANEVIRNISKMEIIAQAGQIKGKDIIPSHFLSMSNHQHSDFKKIELTLDEALNYLERSTTFISTTKENGWHVAGFENTNLGWLKLTSQGWKNHYPMSWRLRSRKT